MFLDANQKKTKSPNKLFEICYRPVLEESKERKIGITTVENLYVNPLQFSPESDDKCLLLQKIWLHKAHCHRHKEEGIESAQQQQHLGVYPDLEEGEEE